MKKAAFIFPGQGAQYPTMGLDFYQSYLVAKEVFQEADELLSFSISKLIFQGSSDELTLTKNSQIAIFVTSAAILKVVEKEFPDLLPSMCGGLSLGEYTALMASQKVTFSEALMLVKKRGLAMHEACLEQKGAMAAVIGLDEAVIRDCGYYVANVNSPGQVVIGGKVDDIEKAMIELKEKGARKVIKLEVSGAFHTPLMQSAKEIMTPVIENAQIKESSIDLVMNVVGDFVSDRATIAKLLIDQITTPTRWMECVRAIDRKDPEIFIELGPSQLAGMNRKIKVNAPTVKIEKLEDLDNVYQTTSR